MSNAAEPTAPVSAAREDPDVPAAKAPRFPYVAAVLCLACIGAAVWTWIGWSYVWHATPSELFDLMSAAPPLGLGPAEYGRYVRLRGEVTGQPLRIEESVVLRYVADPAEKDVSVMVRCPHGQSLGNTVSAGIVGRVVEVPDMTWMDGYPPIIDTTRSRFHPASIAGLVVGAMGVFVFAVALRQWLKERRVFMSSTPE